MILIKCFRVSNAREMLSIAGLWLNSQLRVIRLLRDLKTKVNGRAARLPLLIIFVKALHNQDCIRLSRGLDKINRRYI
jgi:hypothetical protein